MISRRVQIWCKCNRVQQGINECILTESMPDTSIISIWITYRAQLDRWIIPCDFLHLLSVLNISVLLVARVLLPSHVPTVYSQWVWSRLSDILNRKSKERRVNKAVGTPFTGGGEYMPTHSHTALLSRLHLASHLAVWILRGYIWKLLHLSAEQSSVNVIEVSVEGWIGLHPLCWESSSLAGAGSEADALFMKRTRHLNSARSGIFPSAGVQNKIDLLLSQTISLYFGV